MGPRPKDKSRQKNLRQEFTSGSSSRVRPDVIFSDGRSGGIQGVVQSDPGTDRAAVATSSAGEDGMTVPSKLL